MAVIACPECQTKLQVPDGASARVRCPKCKTIISPISVTPKPATSQDEARKGEPKSSAKPSPQPAPKSGAKKTSREEPQFEVIDTEPESVAEEEDHPAKKKTRSIDGEDAKEGSVQKKRRSRGEDEEDEQDKPRRNRGKRKKKSKKGLLIGGIVIVGVVVLAGVGFLVSRFVMEEAAFRGEWPDPGVVAVGSEGRVVLHITGVEDQATVDAINEQLNEILPAGPHGAASSWKPPRLTIIFDGIRDIDDFVQRIRIGRVASVRGNVISVAGRKLEPTLRDPVEIALRDLSMPNLNSRLKGLRTFNSTPPDEKHQAEVIRSLEPLLNDSDVMLRNSAEEAFCAWASKQQFQILVKFVHGPPFRDRLAMLALARLKDERGIGPIAERLEDFHSRGSAKDALVKYGKVAEPEVLKYLSHSQQDVRSAACEVLGKIGVSACYEPLAALLVDDNNRASAANALTELGPPAEDAVLKVVLDESNPRARSRACEILVKIGTRKSLPALEKATTDPDVLVKTYSTEAIAEIKKRS